MSRWNVYIKKINHLNIRCNNVPKTYPVLFLRVPILCDFEPLHQHVRALHNLVKAAQSLDEMSQTITDLLNEQKVCFLFFLTKKIEYSIQKELCIFIMLFYLLQEGTLFFQL